MYHKKTPLPRNEVKEKSDVFETRVKMPFSSKFILRRKLNERRSIIVPRDSLFGLLDTR